MVTLFRLHPRLFNCFYKLRERAEGWVALAEKLVEDITRSKTVQTINAEIWLKITCQNLIWTIRRKHDFEPKPRLREYYAEPN
jgi:hypothetical protein